MEVTSLCDSPDYSDLNIKLRDGRVLKCHKFIICRKSEYFRKLCGPGSAFAESKETDIEFPDDNPDAFEAVIRHLYDHGFRASDSATWKQHLEVRTTADKYLLPALCALANAHMHTATGKT